MTAISEWKKFLRIWNQLVGRSVQPTMKRHILFAPLVSVSLVLAACGADGDAAIDPPAAQSPATTSAPVDDIGLRAPEPIDAVTGSAGRSADASVSVAAESEIATNDMMIAPFVAEYVLGGDLALPTNDVGFVFDASVALTAEQVAGVAAALGVEGEPVRDEQGVTTWRVGPDDGSAPTVWVYDDAQQSWNYSSAWASGVVEEACAVAVDSEGKETGECPVPEPPVGVPGAAEAEQRARETLSALGLDPAALTIEVSADEWSANVNVDDRTADHAAIRYWNFGYGAEGVLQYAGGTLATPEPVGPYPLVDLDTAVARLREMSGFGVPMPLLVEPAVESDAATTGVAPDPSTASATEVTAETVVAIDDPILIDPPMGDQEAVTVTLVDVQPDLWWVWDAEGSLWLVPAYRFIDTDGGWHVVPAVTEEFLVQVEPPVDDRPIPIEGDGGIGDGAEPLPTTEPLPALPDEQPDAPPDVQPIEPGTDPAAALPMFEQFIGLSIEEFTAEAKALGYATRVVQQDGEPLAVTADYSETRVNVEVEGPMVTALQSIG